MTSGVSKKQILSFLEYNCFLLEISWRCRENNARCRVIYNCEKAENDPSVYTKEEWLSKLGYILMECYSLIAIRNDDTSKLNWLGILFSILLSEKQLGIYAKACIFVCKKHIHCVQICRGKLCKDILPSDNNSCLLVIYQVTIIFFFFAFLCFLFLHSDYIYYLENLKIIQQRSQANSSLQTCERWALLISLPWWYLGHNSTGSAGLWGPCLWLVHPVNRIK